MSIRICTIESRLSKSDAAERSIHHQWRTQDLEERARIGYTLMSTITVDSADYVTVIDTLQRIETD